MKVEIATFPVGGAQGLAVLRLDCEREPFDIECARGLVDDHSTATGIWGVWLVNVTDWTAPDLREFTTEQDAAGRAIVAIREIADKVWPAIGCEFVLDGSAAIANASNVRELASYLNEHAEAHPVVQDLVVTLAADQTPPPSNVLDMLAEFVNAACMNYLYLPTGYEFRALALRSITRCGSRWALR